MNLTLETDAPCRTSAPPVPPSRSRFTIDGDAALELHLDVTCRKIAAGLRGLVPPGRLEAVLLGGGYGRGEGGVLRTAQGDHPYNDLEFYVCIRGNRHLNERRHGRALHVLGEILTPQAGIDVEFRITSLQELATGRVSMFSYDLISGHRWLIGTEPLLDGCAHHRNGEDIPLTEATRLLMNRASGLLFAAERLRLPSFSEADADFVARNIAKAQLGMGDALLTVHGDYHWSVHERHRRLERLARMEASDWLRRVREQHAFGVEFKLHPVQAILDREELARRHAETSELCRLGWLWTEGRRLRSTFRSIREYSDPAVPKCPETLGPRNMLVNASLFGLRGVLQPHLFRHPRERTLHTLPLLLWENDLFASRSVCASVQQLLHTTATDFPGLVSAYRDLWAKVN